MSSAIAVRYSDDEQRLLSQCETTINHGLETFLDVGAAFITIREEALYRHRGTFADYCEDVWGLSESRVSQIMRARRVALLIEANGGDPPTNSTQADGLGPLLKRPRELMDAWEEAQAAAKREGKSVSGRHIRAVVRKRLGGWYGMTERQREQWRKKRRRQQSDANAALKQLETERQMKREGGWKQALSLSIKLAQTINGIERPPVPKAEARKAINEAQEAAEEARVLLGEAYAAASRAEQALKRAHAEGVE